MNEALLTVHHYIHTGIINSELEHHSEVCKTLGLPSVSNAHLFLDDALLSFGNIMSVWKVIPGGYKLMTSSEPVVAVRTNARDENGYVIYYKFLPAPPVISPKPKSDSAPYAQPTGELLDEITALIDEVTKEDTDDGSTSGN